MDRLNDKRITSFAASKTYELVVSTGIHAHPIKQGYPPKPTQYLMVRAKGGRSDALYEVEEVVDIELSSQNLSDVAVSEANRNRLTQYISQRNSDVGFKHKGEYPYRFYLLRVIYHFEPAYLPVQNTQGFYYLELNQVASELLDSQEQRNEKAYQLLDQLKKDTTTLSYHRNTSKNREWCITICLNGKDIAEVWSAKDRYVIYTNTITQEEKGHAVDARGWGMQYTPDEYGNNTIYNNHINNKHRESKTGRVAFFYSIALYSVHELERQLRHIIRVYKDLQAPRKFQPKVYLLTWNEKKWDEWPGGYKNTVREIQNKNPFKEEWTVANKSISSGDTLYLMKTGSDQGIVAKGVSLSFVHESLHFDKDKALQGEMTNHITALFTEAVSYEDGEHIKLNELRDKFPDQNWTPQASGIQIRQYVMTSDL